MKPVESTNGTGLPAAAAREAQLAYVREVQARLTDLEQEVIRSALDALRDEGPSHAREAATAFASLQWNDPRELWFDAGGQSPLILPRPPVFPFRKNQKRGEDLPVYTTEGGLNFLRNSSRLLCAESEFAISALTNRVNYTLGTGLVYRVDPVDKSVPSRVVDDAQQLLDLFNEYNAIDEIEAETLTRADIDGEAFLRLFPGPDGMLRVRFVEPELVTSPTGAEWDKRRSFGIETDPQDVENVLGYWIVESPDTSWQPVLVPASDVLHFKTGTFRSAKRGRPLFYAVERNLRDVEGLFNGLTAMARARAKIALIRRMKGITSANAKKLQESVLNVKVTDPNTGVVRNIEQLDDGTILTASDSIDYEMPVANTSAAEFIEVAYARLRAVAARLNMPEWMLTSNATDMGAYTSSLVAEAPSTRNFLRLQKRVRTFFAEGRLGLKKSLAWRFFDHCIEIGLLPPEARRWLKVTAEAPSLVVRNRGEEASVNQIYHDLRVKSRETIQQEQGLNPDEERERLARESGARELQSLAGSQTLAQLQTLVYSGQIPRAAAVANVVAVFKVSTADAEALFPEELAVDLSPDANPPGVKADDGSEGGEAPTPAPSPVQGGFDSGELGTILEEATATEAILPNKIGPGCHDSQTGHPAPCPGKAEPIEPAPKAEPEAGGATHLVQSPEEQEARRLLAQASKDVSLHSPARIKALRKQVHDYVKARLKPFVDKASAQPPHKSQVEAARYVESLKPGDYFVMRGRVGVIVRGRESPTTAAGKPGPPRNFLRFLDDGSQFATYNMRSDWLVNVHGIGVNANDKPESQPSAAPKSDKVQEAILPNRRGPGCHDSEAGHPAPCPGKAESGEGAGATDQPAPKAETPAIVKPAAAVQEAVVRNKKGPGCHDTRTGHPAKCPDKAEPTPKRREKKAEPAPKGKRRAKAPGRAEPKSAKVRAALAKHPPIGAEVQRWAEEHNEPQLAKALKGASFRDNEPIDVVVPDKDGFVAHGIEVKTLVRSKTGAVRMKPYARERKADWESRNNATFHTVVIDDRKVFNANGPGQHDESKRVYYYRRGYGNYRVSAMYRVRSLKELRRLLDTPDEELPEAARRIES